MLETQRSCWRLERAQGSRKLVGLRFGPGRPASQSGDAGGGAGESRKGRRGRNSGRCAWRTSVFLIGGIVGHAWKQQAPNAFVMSVDVLGPTREGVDSVDKDGAKAKYAVVTALTVPVKKSSGEPLVMLGEEEGETRA